MDRENKREETRRTLIIYLDCIDLETGKEVGKVVDITRKGFMLLSETPLIEERPQSFDKTYRFEIKLPATETFRGKKLTVEGICRRIKTEKNQNICYMGFSFNDRILENEELIDLLIEKIGFSNGQRKIHTGYSDIEYKEKDRER